MGGKSSKGHGRRESRTPSQSQPPAKEDNAASGDLFTAAEKGSVQDVKALLAGKADVNAKNKSGATALHHAAAAGHKDVMDLLLEAGASLEALDVSKCSPLYYGVVRGDPGVVTFLLEKRASLMSGTGGDSSMLFTAVKHRHYEMVNLLLAAKADIDAPNHEGETPLIAAMEQEREADGEEGKAGQSIVNLLLEKKATPTAKSGGDPTVLMKAAVTGNEDMVHRCCKTFSMSDINSQDRNGKTALLYAADKGHINIVRLLCESKAHADQEDNDGNTPLIVAAKNGYTDVIRVLLSTGQADPHHRTSTGQTAISVARVERQPEALKLLSNEQQDVESLDALKAAIKDEGGEFSKRGTAKFVKDYGGGAGGFSAFYNS